MVISRMPTEQQLELLKQYKDKSFISSLLAEQSHSYFVFVKNIINIPLIITNSAMVIINATITDDNLLKILNIILNSSTGLILSLISNFKVYESIQQHKQLMIKFNKLTHNIDSKLTNDIDSISTEYIQSCIEDYDAIYEAMEFTFPEKIKQRIKRQYENRMILPSSLSVDIVNCNDKCCKV